LGFRRELNYSPQSTKTIANCLIVVAAPKEILELVEQMLELNKALSATRTPPERISLERQIAATDAQFDRLVYDLYGLTKDEIKIVEGAT
jgi:hypothetical protein